VSNLIFLFLIVIFVVVTDNEKGNKWHISKYHLSHFEYD